MGQTESVDMGIGVQGSSTEFNQALASFSNEEQDQLDKCFRRFLKQEPASPEPQQLNRQQFHLSTNHILSKPVENELFHIMCHLSAKLRRENSSEYVTKGGFVVCMAALLKGSIEDRTQILHRLCVGDEKLVSHDRLIKFLEDVLNMYILVESDTAEFMTWTTSVTKADEIALAEFLIYELKSKGNSGYNSDDLEKWLGHSSLVLTMLDAIFHTVFCFKFVNEELNLLSFRTPTIPFCLAMDWKEFHTILSVPSLLFLNSHIPAHLRRQWRLLFSSKTHGESFSTMVNHINGQGPCLLVVRDKSSHIFGGFSSTGFQLSSEFTGDEHCFVYTLQPKMSIFPATGYNKNFCYFNLHQQTMPNGLGFGGLLEMNEQPVHFFGLWLDSEYGVGKSQANCSTYNSLQLSAKENFEIETIEIWGVGPKSGHIKEKRSSVLDIDPEVKAMLAMLGKGPLSDGLRQGDSAADTPEDHKLYQEKFT